MSETKIQKITSEAIAGAAHKVGVIALSVALTLSVLELPDEAKRAILPAQVAPAWANAGEDHNNPVRREREETAPHSISYSEVQRTPARSGRL